MRAIRFLSISLSLAVVGCQVFTTKDYYHGPFLITTDKSDYVAGSTVVMGVRNVSGHEEGYNLCLRVIQRNDGGAWTAVVPNTAFCTMQLVIFKAGDSTTASVTLPAWLPNGTYRVLLPGLIDPRSSPDALTEADRATPVFAVRALGA
jgi:hypothetical protein